MSTTTTIQIELIHKKALYLVLEVLGVDSSWLRSRESFCGAGTALFFATSSTLAIKNFMASSVPLCVQIYQIIWVVGWREEKSHGEGFKCYSIPMLVLFCAELGNLFVWGRWAYWIGFPLFSKYLPANEAFILCKFVKCFFVDSYSRNIALHQINDQSVEIIYSDICLPKQ